MTEMEYTNVRLPVRIPRYICPSCGKPFSAFGVPMMDVAIPFDSCVFCPFCGKPMAPDDTPTLTTYHQLDPRWKDVRLGFGGVEDTTIGRYGCVLCCMAMAAERATHETLTPPQANELVKRAGGFTGTNGNRFAWAAGGAALGLEYRWSKSWVTTPANIGEIIAEVDTGGYVLILVDYDPSTRKQDEHWVLIRRHLGDGVFSIDDPLTGDVHKFPPVYCRRGWDAGVSGVWNAARGIFKAVVFAWDGT